MVDKRADGIVLVTGATGYIGGRLAPRLLELGYPVRCLVRDPTRLAGRPWAGRVEVATGDVLDRSSLLAAMRGVEVAYYLVHSMGAGRGFHERDVTAARLFGEAARDSGVRRIIYLGGLAHGAGGLSEHLRSRQETGDALRAAGVPVTEFRAGVIVGSGSLSFEMIRYLTERLPVMICPRWVFTRTQPIGIREVLEYLTAALDTPASAGRVVEIGGADVISYGDMMMLYAEVRGLRRWMVPVPVLTPRLSSLWVNLVTPIPASIARPLIEGLRNESVVRDASARELFPQIVPAGYRVSVERALARLEASSVETAWSDALSAGPAGAAGRPVILTTFEGMVIERRRREVAAPPEVVFQVITGLGGARGWLYMNWAWRVRGFLDRLIGGVGLRRGRRHPDELRVGDALDFWRVEALEPGRLLRLRAEMKVPGNAWLQFSVVPREGGGAVLTQTAFFAPKGLMGWLYWYGLYPIHGLIFSGLIKRIGERAERHRGA
ncbi:MAG: SDR family oxidoreductase [Candidatus Sumerlaeaceae bacterium]|nr:SDR family oxidoreductase [Candidatus Sumerlaeaceae bacterium]